MPELIDEYERMLDELYEIVRHEKRTMNEIAGLLDDLHAAYAARQFSR